MALEEKRERNELTLLTAAVLRDIQPSGADAVFAHSGNDLEIDLLVAVAALCRRLRYQSPKMVLNGLEQYESIKGSWGYKEWTTRLYSPLGFGKDNIVLIPPAPHTGKEAEEFMRLCQKNKWKRVVIAARPYHMPRCFLSQLGWAQKLNMDLRIYCLTVDCDWGEKVVKRMVTGGDIDGTRLNQLLADLDRIELCRQKYLAGDANFVIASAEEGLNHIKSRAKAV